MSYAFTDSEVLTGREDASLVPVDPHAMGHALHVTDAAYVEAMTAHGLLRSTIRAIRAQAAVNVARTLAQELADAQAPGTEEHSVDERRKIDVPEAQFVTELINLYVNQEWSVRRIARKYRVAPGTIRRRLVAAGVKIRP